MEYNKIDPAKEIFQISRILSDTANDESTRLTQAIEHVARITHADRVYVGRWDDANQTMATTAQWNTHQLEPMPLNVIKFSASLMLEEYLGQNTGMFKLHVEPVLFKHQFVGLLSLESSVPVSHSLDGHEQYFIQLAAQLLAPYIQNCGPKGSPEEIIFESDREEARGEVEKDGTPLVLIVEDNKINQFAMSEIWTRMGLRTLLADSGADAIQLCSNHKFDLILMDLSMPRMDGFDTTREIVTNSAKNKDTPIVAVTAVTEDGTETRCKKVGMVDYITKPLRLQRARELVKTYFPELA